MHLLSAVSRLFILIANLACNLLLMIKKKILAKNCGTASYMWMNTSELNKLQHRVGRASGKLNADRSPNLLTFIARRGQ